MSIVLSSWCNCSKKALPWSVRHYLVFTLTHNHYPVKINERVNHVDVELHVQQLPITVPHNFSQCLNQCGSLLCSNNEAKKADKLCCKYTFYGKNNYLFIPFIILNKLGIVFFLMMYTQNIVQTLQKTKVLYLEKKYILNELLHFSRKHVKNLLDEDDVVVSSGVHCASILMAISIVVCTDCYWSQHHAQLYRQLSC